MLLLNLLISTATAATFTYSDPNCTAGFVMTSTGQIVCASLPPPPPPPPPPVISCAGFQNTLVMHVTIPPKGSGSGPRIYNTDPRSVGGAGANFNAQDALVVVFDSPPATPLFTFGITQTGGQTGPVTTRTYALSTTPCDFTNVLFTDQNSQLSLRLSSGTSGSGRVDLLPGQTYYMNVKNYAYGNWTCINTCNIFVTPGNP